MSNFLFVNDFGIWFTNYNWLLQWKKALTTARTDKKLEKQEICVFFQVLFNFIVQFFNYIFAIWLILSQLIILQKMVDRMTKGIELEYLDYQFKVYHDEPSGVNFTTWVSDVFN